ncbi:MAG: hypothetical protein QG670_1802 [Thermoproteota archaeon]|nr:hypothetical protein [Thermoproteota archaeon]
MSSKDGNQDHNFTVKKEFARQSESMQESRLFSDKEIIDRISAPVIEMQGSIRVLDLGCGPGILTTALASHVSEVVGLDITPEMIERACQRSIKLGLQNVRFEVGEAENLPFGDSYFDAIVTRLTFHHFTSPARVLGEMVRVLRRGGKLIIADVISSENTREAEIHNALEALRDPSHLKMLSFKELKSFVETSGLKITGLDEWINEREFGEWIKIANAPERERPLFTVMKYLAEAGVTGGINLRFEDGSRINFNHHWIRITAEK